MKRLLTLAIVAALAGCAGLTPIPEASRSAHNPETPDAAFEVATGGTLEKPVIWNGKENLHIRGRPKHNDLNLRQANPRAGIAGVYVTVEFAPTPENSEMVNFTDSAGGTSRLLVPPASKMYYCPFATVNVECRPKDENGNEMFAIRRIR